MEIIGETNIDFVGKTRLFGTISILVTLASAIGLFYPGFRLGTDFAGGTSVEVRVAESATDVDESALRKVISGMDLEGAVITRVSDPADPASRRDFSIHVRLSRAERPQLGSEIVTALTQGLGTQVTLRGVESIGPRAGAELRRNAAWAMVLTWIVIMIYVGLRFEPLYAPGAVISLVHDVFVVCLFFVVFRWEFDLNVLAALLVTVGYSINDTIVIYDRIRELVEVRGKTHFREVVNQAINQTLSRTILTVSTVLVVVIAMVVIGGPVLRGFSVALLIGCITGTYSTVYVATGTLLWFERRWHPERAEAAPAARGSRA
jgi:preprotein translocase subunit SecF